MPKVEFNVGVHVWAPSNLLPPNIFRDEVFLLAKTDGQFFDLKHGLKLSDVESAEEIGVEDFIDPATDSSDMAKVAKLGGFLRDNQDDFVVVSEDHNDVAILLPPDLRQRVFVARKELRLHPIV